MTGRQTDGIWREGDYWAARFQGRETRLKDSKGLAYLSLLLEYPDREFHSLDLYRLTESSVPGITPDPSSELHLHPGSGVGPALDEPAKAAYLARIGELKDELAEAEKWNDVEKVARAKAEIEAIEDQIAEAVGLGGRDRPIASDSERARQNVGRAIRKAMSAVSAEIPKLGSHLERAIKTGTFNSYSPAPDAPLPYLKNRPTIEDIVPTDSSGRPLPTGIITFLLTDIEGSTRLWEQHPAEMETALARHDLLIQEEAERNSGVLIKTKGEGDSTFSVFARATDAASCALRVMRSLFTDDLGFDLKVRMALHSGEAELRDSEYYGPAVNKCARIRETAHGGQILLSRSTYEFLRDRLPVEATIKDLGTHALRDLERPEPIFQLGHQALPDEFPAIRSKTWQPHNLPPQLTSFVGRSEELTKVSDLLHKARIVTLTGTGGSGKTRLAIQAASQSLADWPDGTWLVDLAPIFEPDYVPRAVALAVGVKETPRRPVLEDVIERIGDGQVLLIFDNCEHLLDPCAEVVSELLQCPKLKILATTREPLGVMGEVTFRLGSLELPRETAQLEQIAEADSVRLFVDRARAMLTDFHLDASTAPAVAYICRRLDGLPLAIELAAARIKMFSIHELAANLESSFKLVSGGLRTSLPRHRTLEATIAWSYDLLTDRQRALFDRLSVFSGGWSLEGMLKTFENMGWDRETVLADMEGLIDKSLVVRDEVDGGRVRYRMLESLRQYGSAQLSDSGQISEARDAHLNWMKSLAITADAKLDGPEAPAYLDQLEEEIDNLRTALEWAIASGQSEEGFTIATPGFGSFWLWRSHTPEGREWMGRLLEVPTDVSNLHARTLHCAARVAFQTGNYDEGGNLALRASEMYRDLKDVAGEARSRLYIAMCKWASEDYDEVGRLIEEAIEPARRAGHSVELALALGFMALWLAPKDVEKAREFGDEAAKYAEMSKGLNWVAHIREFRAHVALFGGDLKEASDLLKGAVPLYRELGNRSCGVHCLETVAAYLAENGEPEAAAELLGSMEAARETLGTFQPAYERIGYERGLAAVRAGMEETDLHAAWDRGRELSYEDATSRVLDMFEKH